MYNFGAGRARLTPAGGGSPLELGVVQSASLELKVDLKELRGPYRFPIAIGDGKGTASGKVSFAQLWPSVLAGILGGTQSQGGSNQTAAIAEQGTTSAVITGPPTTATYLLGNHAAFTPGTEIVTLVVAGYGPVFYNRVASGSELSAGPLHPANGAYSINNSTGLLTFAGGDATTNISVTYLYSTTGSNASEQVGVALAQVGLNTALTFALTLIGTGRNYYTNGPQQFIVNLNACLAPSLKFDFKLDDFTMMDLDFSAFIDQNGNLGNIYMLNP